LMNNGFEPRRLNAPSEGGELLPVQIVTRRQALQALAEEEVRGEFICDVQREITDTTDLRILIPEQFKRREIANEHEVRVCSRDGGKNPLLAWLDDAQRGEPDGHARRASASDRLAVTADVFKIAIHRRRPQRQRRVELLGRADQDMERGRRLTPLSP